LPTKVEHNGKDTQWWVVKYTVTTRNMSMSQVLTGYDVTFIQFTLLQSGSKSAEDHQ